MQVAEKTIWTIGHSTRSLKEFNGMLRSFAIEQLVDVRHFPGSRKYPHFNKDEFDRALSAEGIGYVHIEALGGRRKPLADSKNTAWRHTAFRGYADYMETPEFIEGVNYLQKLADEKKTAYMCSEAVWWRCHRAMISDYLKANAWVVHHIMSNEKATEHPFTAPAKIEGGKLVYSL